MMRLKDINKASTSFHQVFVYVFLIVSSFYTHSVYAAVNIPSMDEVVKNIGENIPQLMRLVTSMAYVMGMWLVIQGVMGLKKFGEQRTQMSQEHSLKGPIILLSVGAALLYLPSSVATSIATLWDTTVPYAYKKVEGDPWTDLISNIFLIVQLVGTIAFIRGLILMTKLSGHSQQGGLGKAMAHIVGGVLCINMYQTVTTVLNTMGLNEIIN